MNFNKKENFMIYKRDGTLVPFIKQKIINAINSAFIAVDGQLYEDDTANDIGDEIELLASNQELNVEQIQDLIEQYLMKSERPDVARTYIRYRYKKEAARNYQKDFIDAIREKLSASNVQNQNANVDEHSFGGRTGEAIDLVAKKLALEYLVSPMARKNHEENIIYIHDLASYYIGDHNCLSVPLDDLLANGFNTRQTDVRPANSVNTAFQLVAVLFQLQSLQQFGGVSATHLDWTMVPYVRKSFYKHYIDGLMYCENLKDFLHLPELLENYSDDMSIDDNEYKTFSKAYDYAMEMLEREVHQATEGMYHNLNTLQSRSGNKMVSLFRNKQ